MRLLHCLEILGEYGGSESVSEDWLNVNRYNGTLALLEIYSSFIYRNTKLVNQMVTQVIFCMFGKQMLQLTAACLVNVLGSKRFGIN